LSVTLKLPPLEMKPMKNGDGLKPGVAEVVGWITGCPAERPVVRTRSQVMPRWYSFRSCTSATVAGEHLIEKFLHLLVLLGGGAYIEQAAFAVGDDRGRFLVQGARLRGDRRWRDGRLRRGARRACGGG
jgi:hypothetical protein